jgi:ABC-type transport system substrate-binding protein
LFSTGAAAALLAATGVSVGAIPRRGGRLRVALSGAQRSDDWHRGDGLFMQVARQGLIFETLTEVAADGTLRGELATGWHARDDAREWHFDLRRDVLFHDGQRLAGPDVVASLDAALGAEGEVAAVSSHRIRITLGQPDPGLPFRLSQPDFLIRPAHAAEAGIGTGLYRLRRFEAGRQVLATRVTDHYKNDSAGWFDSVELVSIPSDTVRAQALGEYMVDAADLDDPTLVAGFKDITFVRNLDGSAYALSQGVAMPSKTGQQRPLDDLRAPQRWWTA